MSSESVVGTTAAALSGARPLPNPNWTCFKDTIHDIAARIAKAQFIQRVERYPVKYVNWIAAPTLAAQIEKIKMAITLGCLRSHDDHVNMQVHRAEGDFVHIRPVVTGESGRFHDGSERFGVVVGTGSIRNVELPDHSDFATFREPGLEQASKVKFFD